MSDKEMNELLLELINLPNEMEWVEFKCNNEKPEMIGEYISAIANSAALLRKAKGYIVWGIEDGTHKVIGTTFKPRQTKNGNEELENWLIHQLTPQIYFRFHELSQEDKPIVILEISAATEVPIRFKSEEYIRVGSYKKRLKDHPEKEKELWMVFLLNPVHTTHPETPNYPRIRAFIFINRKAGAPKPEGTILVKLENIGQVIIKEFMVELEVPIDVKGLISVDEPAIMKHSDDGDRYLLRLKQNFRKTPLFPLSNVTLKRSFRTDIQEVHHVNGKALTPCRSIKVTIYADEMPAIHAKLDIEAALNDWTPVTGMSEDNHVGNTDGNSSTSITFKETSLRPNDRRADIKEVVERYFATPTQERKTSLLDFIRAGGALLPDSKAILEANEMIELRKGRPLFSFNMRERVPDDLWLQFFRWYAKRPEKISDVFNPSTINQMLDEFENKKVSRQGV